MPLERKGKLEGLFLCNLAAVLRGCMGQRLRLAAAQRLGPLSPRSGVEFAAQHGVKSVVGQPNFLDAAKLLKLFPLSGKAGVARPSVEKIARCLKEQWKLLLLNPVKIHWPAATVEVCDAGALDPALVRKQFQADEQRITRKCRGSRIGRVAVAGGAEGENLPDVLPGAGEEGDKLMGGRSQVADAPIRGQGSYVQQNSGGAKKSHGLIISESYAARDALYDTKKPHPKVDAGFSVFCLFPAYVAGVPFPLGMRMRLCFL